MTIAVCVKVNDGIILASDSASTITVTDPGSPGKPPEIIKVYGNANKIFNLVKGLPIGAVTAGSGSVGKASISTLAKDLRRRLSGENRNYAEWKIDPDNYTLEAVAEKAREFFVEKCAAEGDQAQSIVFDFWIAGFSSPGDLSELWKVEIRQGQCDNAILARAVDDVGIDWTGERESMSRLILGFGEMLPTVLIELGVEESKVAQAMQIIASRLEAKMVVAPMPIQDAIDLARYLAQTAIGYAKFTMGAETVGGPVEVAAITKHERFKWVNRKHYFNNELNPAIIGMKGNGDE